MCRRRKEEEDDGWWRLLDLRRSDGQRFEVVVGSASAPSGASRGVASCGLRVWYYREVRRPTGKMAGVWGAKGRRPRGGGARVERRVTGEGYGRRLGLLGAAWSTGEGGLLARIQIHEEETTGWVDPTIGVGGDPIQRCRWPSMVVSSVGRRIRAGSPRWLLAGGAPRTGNALRLTAEAMAGGGGERGGEARGGVVEARGGGAGGLLAGRRREGGG